MFPSRYNSRHDYQQPRHHISSTQTGVFSSASSSRSQQTQSGGEYSSRTTYHRASTEHDSELGHLLAPLSPPPSLDQILSVRPSTSGSRRPIPTANSNRHHQSIYDNVERELLAEPSSSSLQQPDTGAPPCLHANSRYQSLYDGFAQASSTTPASSRQPYADIERELFAEPSSSSTQQPDTGAIPSLYANDLYQSLYNGFAQALSTAPTSSRQQLAAQASTSRTSKMRHSCYPGVNYNQKAGKWQARWADPSQGSRRIYIGIFDTQSEAINALNSYKESRGEFISQANNPPGLFRKSNGNWCAKYTHNKEQITVGTFSTKEGAKRALRAHRTARGIHPAMVSRRRKQ